MAHIIGSLGIIPTVGSGPQYNLTDKFKRGDIGVIYEYFI